MIIPTMPRAGGHIVLNPSSNFTPKPNLFPIVRSSAPINIPMAMIHKMTRFRDTGSLRDTISEIELPLLWPELESACWKNRDAQIAGRTRLQERDFLASRPTADAMALNKVAASFGSRVPLSWRGGGFPYHQLGRQQHFVDHVLVRFAHPLQDRLGCGSP